MNRPYSQTDFDPAESRRSLKRRLREERMPRQLRELLFTTVAVVWGIALVLIGLLWLRSFGFGSEGVALRHLVAGTGCGAAYQVGLAPAHRGDPGYWPSLDPDNNGVSCDTDAPPELRGRARRH